MEEELVGARQRAETLESQLAAAVRESEDARTEADGLTVEVADLRESNETLSKLVDELEAAVRAQPVGPVFVDLSTVAASIRNFVRAAYTDNYCQSPSSGEVAAWTKLLVDHGNDLQLSRGLRAEAALDEAKAEIDYRMWSSPEAEFLREGGAC